MKKFGLLFLLTCKICLSQPSMLWQKCLGGTNNDSEGKLKKTPDGGCVFVGSVSSNDGDVVGFKGISDLWLVKTDINGSIQWQKCLGGPNAESGTCINTTTDGGYIIGGVSTNIGGDVTFNNGGSDYWIIKTDNLGNIQWQKSYGGSKNDLVYSIQQTFDGGYIVGGNTLSSNGNVVGNHSSLNTNDFWVLKLNGVGNIVWQKCYGGSKDESFGSMEQTADRGFILTGFSNSINGDVIGLHSVTYPDVWTVKTDSLGNIQWKKCFGGNDYDASEEIHQTHDKGFIIAAWTGSNDGDVSGFKGINSAAYDYWIVKLDSLLNIEWQKCLGGSYSEMAKNVHQTLDSGYVVTGYTYSNDKDVSGHHNSPNTQTDAWIVKLDKNGVITWQKCMGGTKNEWFKSLVQMSDGSFVMLGHTSSNDGDVSGNHSSISVYEDIWFVKLGGIISVEENSMSVKFNLLPNPFSDFIDIEIIGETDELKILRVYDVLGKELIFKEFQERMRIPSQSLISGIYYIEVVKKDKVLYRSKLVKTN